MIRISNVKGASQPNFIEVRCYIANYPKEKNVVRVVNVEKDIKPINQGDDIVGFWRVRGIHKI